MEYLINVLKGAALGLAFVVPGFSGGTMAVILKIYDKLLNAISLNLKKLKSNLPFIITLVIGMGLGIFATSLGLSLLFENYPVATKLTLVGIVLGSLPMIWKECTLKSKFKPVNIIPFIAAFGLMLAMFFIKNAGPAENVVETEFSPALAAKLAGGGFIAAVSMVVPGISGSLMLTILGLYETTLASVKDLNIALIIPIAIGAGTGVLVGAKCISILLEKCRQGTYAIILGLIVGSLFSIFPADFKFNSEGIAGIILFVVGFILPIIFDKLSSGKENVSSDSQKAVEE